MKTIEERAKELNNNGCIGHHPQSWVNDVFKAGAEFAQRWIPVEEELPEKGTWIIIELKVCSSKNKYVTMLPKNDFEINFIKEHVTHWRPIELK